MSAASATKQMTEPQIALAVVEFIHGDSKQSQREYRRWLKATDPDVLGAVYHAVAYHWKRIEPGIARTDFGQLLARLTRASLLRAGESIYGLTGHEAVRIYSGFILECYRERNDNAEAEKCLRTAVRSLAAIYKAGSPRIRRCVVDAGIEHLFEETELRSYFLSWRRDRVLARAYREAAEWADAQKI